MAFIYGIIDLERKSISASDFKKLKDGFSYQDAVARSFTGENFAFGYTYNPKKHSRILFYEEPDFAILVDIRIYKGLESSDEIAKDLLNLYRQKGEGFLNEINGAFSIIIFNKHKKSVYLYKDHIGARPLVYSYQRDRIVFGSHEFGLAKAKIFPVELEERTFISRFLEEPEDYELTVFNNIKKVPPASYLLANSETADIHQYWFLENIKTKTTLTYNQAVEQLRKLLIQATEARLTGGKIGAHISGGIDSTGVAAILTASLDQQLTGYSWTPKNVENFKGVDEEVFIQAYAKEQNVDVRFFELEEFEFTKDRLIPEFEKMSIEKPAMKMAKEDKIDIMYSGWGGDEFVSLSYRGVFTELFYSREWIRLVRECLKMPLRGAFNKVNREIFKPYFSNKPAYGKLDKSSKKDRLELLEPSFAEKHKAFIEERSYNNFFGKSRKDLMLNLYYDGHIQGRLDSWAIQSEYYGFEYRYPLLDKDVLEFWFSIPPKLTFHNSKSRILYRDALKGILLDKIRLRDDKGEGKRISTTLHNIKQGQEFLKDCFNNIKEYEHLPFVDLAAAKKQANKMSNENEWDSKIGVPIEYIRYVELRKKYML